jgi:hypothetical protein
MMRFLMLSAVISLTLASAVAEQADEFRCTFQSRYVCRPGGCEPMLAETDPAFVILRMDANQYGRCTKTCDWYPMTVQPNGVFFDLGFRPGGVQGAKMSQDGSLFIETVSIMDAVIVSHGACKRMQLERSE